MKRTILAIALLLAIGCFYAVSQPVIVEPEPVEVRPVFLKEAEQWDLTKAWYRKVTLPDETNLELKSRKRLTDKQWQALANKIWEAKKNEPEIEEYRIEWDVKNPPEKCPFCSQRLPEGFVP